MTKKMRNKRLQKKMHPQRKRTKKMKMMTMTKILTSKMVQVGVEEEKEEGQDGPSDTQRHCLNSHASGWLRSPSCVVVLFRE